MNTEIGFKSLWKEIGLFLVSIVAVLTLIALAVLWADRKLGGGATCHCCEKESSE